MSKGLKTWSGSGLRLRSQRKMARLREKTKKHWKKQKKQYSETLWGGPLREKTKKHWKKTKKQYSETLWGGPLREKAKKHWKKQKKQYSETLWGGALREKTKKTLKKTKKNNIQKLFGEGPLEKKQKNIGKNKKKYSRSVGIGALPKESLNISCFVFFVFPMFFCFFSKEPSPKSFWILFFCFFFCFVFLLFSGLFNVFSFSLRGPPQWLSYFLLLCSLLHLSHSVQHLLLHGNVFFFTILKFINNAWTYTIYIYVRSMS